MNKQQKHRHRWQLQSYGGWEVSFRCSCGETKSRRMTKAEYDWQVNSTRKWGVLRKSKEGDIHYIFHKFLSQLCDEYLKPKFSGYDLMQRMARFACRYPTCKILTCDDSSHSGSYILLIPHENKTEYWGTTLIITPQFGQPTAIFLYPGHLDEMLKALQATQKKFRRKELLRRKADQQRVAEQKRAGFSLKPKGDLLSDAFIQRKKRERKKSSQKWANQLKALRREAEAKAKK